jgi:hypothetical protein
MTEDPLSLEWNSDFQAGDQAVASTGIWIGAGSSLAAILIVIFAVVMLLGCRRRLLKPASDMTESERETGIPAEGEVSHGVGEAYISEENALSVGGRVANQMGVGVFE